MAKVPPGFRFHPTDVELVLYYLKRKVLGKPLHVQAITELDLYKFSPWDLPGKSCMRSGDREWFFFCPRDRKYANGPRLNRASAVGYWKTTGRDRAICNDSQTVGMKRTLIFHLGRAPKGDRTNWVMHEYRLEIKDLADTGIQQDSYVLCKIFEKSGAGPRNGEQYGAPFREEEWEDDVVDNSLAPLPLIRSGSPSTVLDNEKSTVTENSSVIPAKTCEPLAPLAPVDSGSPSTALDNEKITVTENTNVIPGKTCGPLDPLEPPCQNTSYDEKSVLLTGKTCEPLEPPCQNESYDNKSAPLPGKTFEPLEPPCQSEPYDDKGTLLPGNTREPLEPPCQSAAYDDKSTLLAGKTCEPLEPLCQSASYDVESTLLPGKTCDSLELPSQNASYCENSSLILGKTCKPLELSSQNASSDENSTLIPGKTCKSLELSSQNESSDENSTLIPGNACESYRSKKRKTCESLELPSQIASYNENSTPIPRKTCESLEPPSKKASYDEMFMENQSLIMENLEAARVLIGLSGKTDFSKQIEVASGVSNNNEVDTAEVKAEDLGVMSQNYVRTRNHCGEGEENIGRVSVRGSSIFDRNVDRGGAGGLCCSIKQMVGTDHYNSNFSGGTGTGVQDVASRGERALIQTCDVSYSAREGRQRSMDPKAVSRNGLDKGGPLATRSTEQVIYHGVPKLEVLLALGGQSSSLRRKRKKQNQSSMRVYHRKSRAEHEENDRPKLKSVTTDASLNGDMSDSERNWAEDKNNITAQEQTTERQVMRS